MRIIYYYNTEENQFRNLEIYQYLQQQTRNTDGVIEDY